MGRLWLDERELERSVGRSNERIAPVQRRVNGGHGGGAPRRIHLKRRPIP